MVGIYKITNTLNNKCYIGQSIDIENRWKQHIRASRSLTEGGDNYSIHKAIRKYGVKNFIFEIIELTSIEELNNKEKYWINYYNSYNNGYNETLGGEGKVNYNYEEIFNLWQIGYNYKDIEKIIGCYDKVITRALKTYNLSTQEIRNHIQNKTNKKKPIVALDIDTGTPLKTFSSSTDAIIFLKGENKGVNLKKFIENHYRWEGYYWEYLNEQNIPKENLTNEDFLKYKKEKRKYSTKNILKKEPSLSKEELKKVLRSTPSLTKAADFLNISRITIKKWAIEYGLPYLKKEIDKYSDEEWLNI